jgi:Carboxypeptidase regulatory-like domain/TonB-dependent Receptor Plug Domain
MPTFSSRTLSLYIAAILALPFCCLVTASLGQGITTGTVSGTVTDPSAAVISKATVTALDPTRGKTLTTQSGNDGVFNLRQVPIGTYRITVSASGFSPTQVDNVLVRAGATADLGSVTLKIGTTEEVEVNGSAANLLETSDSQVTTTFSTEQVQSLPLNNGFDTATELIPGVVSTHGDNFSNTNGDNFSVNGQSGRYNNFELDGQSNNDNVIGGPQIFFGSQDAIAQLQVITNDYSAQYGRNAGAVVNYITKSGTNAFHGSGFEFYQGSFLSSLANQQKNPLLGFCAPGENPVTTGCNPPQLPRSVENRWGGTIGGPIFKDKLFFFGSTFWDHVRTGAAPSQSLPGLTPDPAGIQELEAAFPGNSSVAALAANGPYGVKQGNPQAIPVPSASGCPGTFSNGTCIENITGPNGVTAPIEFAGVQRLIPSLFNDEEVLARVDWQPTQRDHLFVRYFYQNILLTGITATNIAAGDFENSSGGAHSVGADWSHTFSNNWVDQLRYSFQQTKVYFQGGAYPDCVVNTIADCPAQLTFNGSNNDQGFGVFSAYPQGRTVKVTQIQDNAVWTHGKHTLLFGGEFDYQNSPIGGLFNYNGLYSFGTFNNFLQDGPGGASAFITIANGNPLTPFTEPDAAGYVQDDWKVSPSFTAHLGLRWEYFGQGLNKLHDETVATESNPNTAIWDQSLPLSVRVFPSVNEFYKGFEPRLGFAWNPEVDKKLVVRGGYAINANPAYYNLYILASAASPVVNASSIICGTTACLPSNGTIAGVDVRNTAVPFLPPGDPRQATEQAFPTNFRTPYVQTYTLGIQHQIGRSGVAEIRYVGSKTTKDFQSTDGNPYLLPVQQALPNYAPVTLCSTPGATGFGRPNCDYGNVSYITNGGWANYNGLQMNLTTQNYRGLTLTASYTHSKLINNATDGFRSTGSAGSSIAYPQNPLNTSSGERGLSGNDFPNVVGISFLYQVPNFVKTKGLLSRVTNGFQLSGIYRYNSGQVYTPYQFLAVDNLTGDSSFCDSRFNGATVGVDTCRLVQSNKKAPAGSVAYLNPYTGPIVGGLPSLGSPEYVVYNTDSATFDNNGNFTSYNPGTPVDPATTRWIINNQAYALAVGNAYPGWSRSLLRGQTFSEFDTTITKTTPITERVSLLLSMAAYNVLNQQYLGTGVAAVASSAFTSTDFNAAIPAPGNTSGIRFILLGGKIVF